MREMVAKQKAPDDADSARFSMTIENVPSENRAPGKSPR